MKRCISCKSDIIRFGETRFEGFFSILPPKEFSQACYFVLRDGRSGPYFPFARKTAFGSFRHLRIERGFWEENIHLRLNDVYVGYLRYHWNVAMCTSKVLGNGNYGKLNSVSEKYTVCSPWFVSENDKDSLQNALAELGRWYDAHLPEINLSYEKQQGWLDKDWRHTMIARGYLDEHISELTEDKIFELYRTVDRLAAEYESSDMKNQKNELGYSAPFSGFNDFCYGKFSSKINGWVDDISELMLAKKAVKGIDMDYARSFAVTALLYLFHDCQKEKYPAILQHKELWK